MVKCVQGHVSPECECMTRPPTHQHNTGHMQGGHSEARVSCRHEGVLAVPVPQLPEHPQAPRPAPVPHDTYYETRFGGRREG